MYTQTQKAFTMVELIFVIIIIGILSAVAVPKFRETAEIAYIAKAKSDVASVKSALALMRQKNILRGATANITAANVGANFTNLLKIPVNTCSGSKCNGWSTNGNDFTFHGPTGDVKFTLGANVFACSSSVTGLCAEYE